MTKVIQQNFKKLDIQLQQLQELIGNTPMYQLRSLSTASVKIFLKLEWMQFSGSVKIRPAWKMVKEGLLTGSLNSESTILEASSGNTGIALAAIGAKLGIPVTICLPAHASSSRKKLLKVLGAQIIETPPEQGTDGAQRIAKFLYEESPDLYWYSDQYSNDQNYLAHAKGTGPEIWRQSQEQITHYLAGLGTTGTFTGVARYLKLQNPKVQNIALQPDQPLHGLEGWKHLQSVKVPGIWNAHVADAFEVVSTEAALDMQHFLLKHEGLLVSPSAAANMYGAVQVASRLQTGHVVTIAPDNIEKYLE